MKKYLINYCHQSTYSLIIISQKFEHGVIGSETGASLRLFYGEFPFSRRQGSEGSVATCVTATCETAQNASA
jgi:hypothetical protein